MMQWEKKLISKQYEQEKKILAGNIVHAIIYNSVKRTEKETGETYYQISETMLKDLAEQYSVYNLGKSQFDCKHIDCNMDGSYCKIDRGSGDFNNCYRVCEYFEEDK